MRKLIDFFKVMSDDTRLRIILLLSKSDLCVCELVGILDLSQPKISKHLAILRKSEIVMTRRDEKYIIYQLNHQNKYLQSILTQIDTHVFEEEQIIKDIKRLSNRDIYKCQCRR